MSRTKITGSAKILDEYIVIPNETTSAAIVPNLIYGKENFKHGRISPTLINEAAELKAKIKFSKTPNFFATIDGNDQKQITDRINFLWNKNNLTNFFKTIDAYTFKKSEIFLEVIVDPLTGLPKIEKWFDGIEYIDPVTGIVDKYVLSKELIYGSHSAVIKVTKIITASTTKVQYQEQSSDKSWKKISNKSLEKSLKNSTIKNKNNHFSVLRFGFEETIGGGTISPVVRATKWLHAADINFTKWMDEVLLADQKLVSKNPYGSKVDMEKKLESKYIQDDTQIDREVEMWNFDMNGKEIAWKQLQHAVSKFFEDTGALSMQDDRGKYQKNALENNLDNSSQLISKESETNLRETQLTKLIYILAAHDVILKKELIDTVLLTVSLRTIDIKTQTELWNILINRYKTGTISLEDVLKQGDGLSTSEANIQASLIRNQSTTINTTDISPNALESISPEEETGNSNG